MLVVSIFGATGTHGSAVLKAVLADGTFTPRAVSRNPTRTPPKCLKRRESRGSDAVFGVTNLWDPSVFPGTFNVKGEIGQGKNLVDATKAVGIKFFVWSDLPSSTALSNGKYSTVYHIDNQAVIWEYLKCPGVPCAADRVTFVPIETVGFEELDVMYAYQSDFGMYKDTVGPNSDLVALGVKIGSLDELISTGIVPSFS
ncbi:hypothetical protein DFH09DRAFT_1332534 [Mycena vulgaris]|nr:hypothetical protein DFH09DRAFT_1332534 [Mycena vulgaris]